MSFFDSICINLILLLFPVFIYLSYIAYSNNTNNKRNIIVFDLVNISAVYLLIKYRLYFPNVSFLLLVNIPLVLLYLKKRNIAAVLVSCAIVIYYVQIYNLPIIYTVIEYLIYFLYFSYFNKKGKKYDFFLYSFIMIKGIILSFEIFYLLPKEHSFIILIFQVFLLLTLFYFLAVLVIELTEKGEQFLDLNKALKELEKERKIREALFKITHEIKNPLSVCKGYLDMMDFRKIDKVKKYNYIIKSEIERSLTIMDDFLDFTKVSVNLTKIDIIKILNETLIIMKPLLKSSHICITKNYFSTSYYILGDKERLKQAFINIIKNSIEAIKEQGKIEVTVKKNGKGITIIIADNGVGIDKDTLLKIKEVFYTTKEKGTGLGIPLIYEIIKLHNGKIKYESKLNIGTKVIICLQ